MINKNCAYFLLDLEEGDILYKAFRYDWGRIEYEYIENIKYCPVCGKKLSIEEQEND